MIDSRSLNYLYKALFQIVEQKPPSSSIQRPLPLSSASRSEGQSPSVLPQLDVARTLLTAVGAMSVSTTLGDGHTIDVSAVTVGEGPSTVILSLYAKIEIEGSSYGIYRLSPAT